MQAEVDIKARLVMILPEAHFPVCYFLKQQQQVESLNQAKYLYYTVKRPDICRRLNFPYIKKIK